MAALRARFQPDHPGAHHHDQQRNVSAEGSPVPRVASRDYFNYVPVSPTVRAPSLPSITPRLAMSPQERVNAKGSSETLHKLDFTAVNRDAPLAMSSVAAATFSPDTAARHSSKFVRRTSAIRKQVAAGDLAMSNISMPEENGGSYYRPSVQTPAINRMDTWRGKIPSSGEQWQTDGVALNSPPGEGTHVDSFELRDAVVVSIAKSIGLAQPSDAAYDSVGRSSIAPSVSALSTPNSPMFPANARSSKSPFGNVLDMMNASRNDDHMIGGMLREAVMHAQEDDMSSVSASVQDSMANGGDVNRSVLRDLEGNVEIMFFKQGSTLVKEGEKSPGIYYVIDGFLDVSGLGRSVFRADRRYRCRLIPPEWKPLARPTTSTPRARTPQHRASRKPARDLSGLLWAWMHRSTRIRRSRISTNTDTSRNSSSRSRWVRTIKLQCDS